MRRAISQRLVLASWIWALALPAGALQDASRNDDVAPVLDLGMLEVRQERWTYDQEVVMRMIRHVYDKPRSDRAEDRDKWVCWVGKERGSRVGYLWCARNGDLMARRPSEYFNAGLEAAGYGTFLRSTQTVNRGKFEKLLESFKGGEAFNEEFLSLVMQGERPPRHVPSDEELASFALARQAVRAADRRVTLGRLKEIAEAHGLTRVRYTQIERHLATYETVRARYAGTTIPARE